MSTTTRKNILDDAIKPKAQPSHSPVLNSEKDRTTTHEQKPSEQLKTPFLVPNQTTQSSNPTVHLSYQQMCQSLVDDTPANAPSFQLGELQNRFLLAHNKDRSRFGQQPLVWSNELAQHAQRWADYLKTNYACAMHHRSALNQREGKEWGENLAWNQTSKTISIGYFASNPEKQVYGWNSECIDYNLDSNTCQPGKQCRHFTQALWDSTTEVGCGVAVCNAGDAGFSKGGRAEIWVCNYNPQGNITITDQNKITTKLRPFKLNPPEQGKR
ncbi:MAG: hypothetical protein KC505_08545 [Myxococcales bacterium]|nr:hypothetical protein [Myxococcales bacterium]USN50247.1 MAG: hypothetical protein H6731_08235 [Myxococcales bacterium]